VSACFCKCISLFQGSLYYSALMLTGSLPSNSPVNFLRQLTKLMTCLWIPQYLRTRSVNAMAYQRGISEVLSSSCLKNPARRECSDTRSGQALRSDHHGSKTRFGHHFRLNYKSGLMVTSPFHQPIHIIARMVSAPCMT